MSSVSTPRERRCVDCDWYVTGFKGGCKNPQGSYACLGPNVWFNPPYHLWVSKETAEGDALERLK